MDSTQVELTNDFIVIGRALRTSPERAASDIPDFWRRFVQEAPGTIGAPNADLYAVYCDYETDHRGPYTLVLGYRGEGTAEVPPGMRRVRVPFGQYASFAAKGDPAQVIWSTWAHVNTEWPQRHRRRYIADYERYPANAMASATVEAQIVVGVT
ncbi:MAG TPA: effector binding domain-containing protein [Polyangiaceae bacterium]|nr:effector binding domain-containing protein [Polyangiaceae bacterium]